MMLQVWRGAASNTTELAERTILIRLGSEIATKGWGFVMDSVKTSYSEQSCGSQERKEPTRCCHGLNPLMLKLSTSN